MEISFVFFHLLLGVKEVVNLIIQDSSVGAHNRGSVSVKIPVGDTQKEKAFEMEFTRPA